MKKVICAILVSCICLGLMGCGVKQEDYDKAVSDASSVAAELDVVKSELNTAKSELETISQEKTAVEQELAEYKEKLKPFEEMTAAQAEAEKAKAEAEKAKAAEDAKKKKAAEKKAAAEAEKKAKEASEAEEAKGYDTGVTYKDIARTPDDYIGKKVKFSGKVIQLIEGDEYNQIRFIIDEDYDQVILGEYDPAIVKSRILEDDLLTIYGTSAGTISYNSTLGGKITVPAVLITKIEFSN